MTTPRFYNCYQDQDPGLSPKSTRLVFKAVGRPMGSGRTPTQPEPKTVSFRRISVQQSKGTA